MAHMNYSTQANITYMCGEKSKNRAFELYKVLVWY